MKLLPIIVVIAAISIAATCTGGGNPDCPPGSLWSEELDKCESFLVVQPTVEAPDPAPEGIPIPENIPGPDNDYELEAKLQELFEDVDSAVIMADTFWATHWSEFFTGRYVSPTVFGGYEGEDTPLCDGVYEPAPGNAFYCEPDDYIAWDWYLFTEYFLDDVIGDSFVYFAIAHEWAHAIQARVGLDEELTQISELQADCLAAATIIGSERDGVIFFEDGDLGEIYQSLTTLADEVEWANTLDHGTADQRVRAWQIGQDGGVDACFN